MLYRCASRRGSARAFFKPTPPRSRAIPPPRPAATRRSTRVARVRDVAAASGARLRGDAHAVDAAVARDDGGLGAARGAKTTETRRSARRERRTTNDERRTTNATLTRTRFSPLPYTQAHAQLRPARAVGRGQQGERAVSAGHGARRRDRRGARAFERRRRARRRRATFDFEEGGVNGWNGRARSAARYGTRALCSALIRGARRDARDVASGRRRDLDSVLATVIHASVATTRQTNIEHRLVSLRVQRHSRYARQETGPTARVVRVVASRVAYRSDASRPAAKSANESSDVGGVHCCAAAGGT